jgi:hypothetical protein
MNGPDAEEFAQRLYARIPANYRAYDAQRGQPLLALLRVVGEQVANVRQDLDTLWDNFFIETCDDWVVPYLGALVGTNLLPQPVDQRSNRLDVANTVPWRRSKGTLQTLAAVSQAISGWSADVAEFFQVLGWSQNMNHVRLDRPLNPDLRDPYPLSLLGRATDPLAHAADFKSARALDQPRVVRHSVGIGEAAWSTPGRYQIKNLGVFVRRLQTFPISGATPASVIPGAAPPAMPTGLTFNPLFRDMPLFLSETRTPVTRADFSRAPWLSFGSDIAVRQFGVLLASEIPPEPELTSGSAAFTFGGAGSGLSLHPTAGMRLLEPRSFELGAAHFLIAALWRQSGGLSRTLGMLSTLYAASAVNRPLASPLSAERAFWPINTATGSGQLLITIQTGRSGTGWPGPNLPASAAARFPGAILAIRAARKGALHVADGLYVYLPPAFVVPGKPLSYYVADDGSTFATPDFSSTSLTRSSEGQIYPGRISNPTTAAADSFTVLNRTSGGLYLPDPARFGGLGVLYEAGLFPPSPVNPLVAILGAIATVDQPSSRYPFLHLPAGTWPAFTYGPSNTAILGQNQEQGFLSVLAQPLSGNFIPAIELVVVNRSGQSLLVYLPEVSQVKPGTAVRFLVAQDGSTYFPPADITALQRGSYEGLSLARAAQGQVLPIPAIWPLQQRLPVAVNLCRWERSSALELGELAIDPELGRFAFPDQDPAVAQGALSVDYVEAFSDQIGALGFYQPSAPISPATRLVSRSGDADSPLTAVLAGAPIHSTLAEAIAAAKEGDVIEIVDSATYADNTWIEIRSVQNLTIRASGQRPCLAFYSGPNLPAVASFVVRRPMATLALAGLLISGGPALIHSSVQQLSFAACTFDPLTAATASLFVTGNLTGAQQTTNGSNCLLTRCITGGLQLGPGVAQLTAADSIIDQQNGYAIAGNSELPSPLLQASFPFGIAVPSAAGIQLERATVLGLVFCEVLSASDSLLNDVALVEDQQSGCIRFTRFEFASVLPRRYQCVPSESQAKAGSNSGRLSAPAFNSLRYGRPDYAQLAAACPREILTASEAGAEVGAFSGTLNTIRLNNLRTKLGEFMPVGLSAVVVAET